MSVTKAYNIITKPIGPVCNLSCEYCFYLEKKQALFPRKNSFVMDDDILESYIRQYIESQDIPEVHFAWQGGEPTLLGVEYFKRVTDLQKRYANGKKISNGFQTNGILLDNYWCDLFGENDFLIGLSMDGPVDFHDRYRRDKKGKPTFKKVFSAACLMKRQGIKFNMLAVINDVNSRRPQKTYQFLREAGDGFIQFIPLLERVYDTQMAVREQSLCPPGDSSDQVCSATIASWSVKPEHLAQFYIGVFDEWMQNDVGNVFIQFFDTALGNWMGTGGGGVCHFAETCGTTCAIEHNGDVYSCDHYVYPQYYLGNIMVSPLKEIVASEKQHRFSREKKENLAPECLQCDHLKLCNGDCPKHRFYRTDGTNTEKSYFCSAYKKLFSYMSPYLEKMSHLILSGRPASDIMGNPSRSRTAKIKPNSLCPCGSHLKFKKCCGKKGRSI